MGKVVVITGASAGIGLATGLKLYSKGHIVYGMSRSISDKELPFHKMDVDVTQESSVQEAINIVLEQHGYIDVLVNSAGYSLTGPIEEISDHEMKAQFDTNFFGLLTVTKAVIKGMRHSRKGLIINVSSVGGLMGLPYQGGYSASKYAVEGVSEALSMELAPFNIKVKLVEPGDTITSFTANRVVCKAHSTSSPYAKSFNRSIHQIQTDEGHGMVVEKVADKLVKIIDKKHTPFRSIIGIPMQKLAVVLKNVLPYYLFEAALKQHYKV